MNLYKNIEELFKRTIVIGDIHGCFDELMKLLEIIEYSSDDLIISVGDMVDRGPQSWEVVKFFKSNPNIYSVLGNHERRVSGVIKGSSQPAWSQLHSLSKLAPEERQMWSQWFDELPAVIETKYAIITHARLDPIKSIKNQDPYYTCAVGGESVKIELDDNGIPSWYNKFVDNYQIKKPICIGHISYSKVELIKGKLYALDTDAVHAGVLTAIIFPEKKIVSIKVKENYYDKSYKEWIIQKYSSMDVSTIKLSKIESIIKQSQINEFEQKIIRSFHDKFYQFSFLGKAEKLKALIPRRLGTLPNIGKEKGEYFSRLNTLLIDANQKKLIKILLTQKNINVHMFINLFPTLSLLEIDKVFKSLEEFLNI